MDKASRLRALLPNQRGVWIPIDHGASDYPNPGLENLDQLIPQLIDAGVDVILAQKGVVGQYAPLCEGTRTNMVVHFSVSTRHAGPNSNNKVMVGHADETLARGGMGVSSQVNMGSEAEPEMIERMGDLNRHAHLLGLPAFGMVYPRGPNLNPVPGDVTGGQAHAVRLAFELGCDAAKCTWTGDASSFAEVASAAPIPVLVAGGPASGNEREVLTMVHQALQAGASGVCMGRQVFAHPNPGAMANALVKMVHEGASVDEALAQVEW
ncbi:MAG: fructose-bisphosphate aldolase [Candidatus Poseidonia sp.]|jgi:DhnA family fructose-bisphosphate aldolase class Ia|nr:fructose-bisphosphate aldolase [Poseidonia sp.]